jgi:hypothetical protein
MYGQEIFRRRSDPSLNAAEVSFRLASDTKWRLAERRVAMVRLLVEVRHEQWVRAESAKAYRPHAARRQLTRFASVRRMAPFARASCKRPAPSAE